MCGIAGIVEYDRGRSPDRGLLESMTTRLAHRGPDGDGFFVDKGVGFGHRRLSIIDLAGGAQPMPSHDGRFVISFNGEIYNFQDLRKELEDLGHRFVSDHSDTEVILEAWRAWGEDCLTRLRGMYAFAIFDKESEHVFVVRDRLGKKPVYYVELQDQRVLFASELKALECCKDFSRALCAEAIEDYFSLGYIPDPKSIYRAVRKLPPATVMKLERGKQPIIREYWKPGFDAAVSGSARSRQDDLMDRLQAATRLRMISDVPLGAFLSGGVDSSAIIAVMSGLSQNPVKSFSIGFRDKAYDETTYARKVAELYETEHTEEIVDPDDFELVDRLAGMFDEPYGDSSALPTYRVCEAARKHVTVCLSGDGGDELFGGYRRYRFHQAQEKLKARLPGSFSKTVFGLLGTVYPKLDWAPRFLRARTTFQELAMDEAESLFNGVSATSGADRRQLMSAAFRSDLQSYQSVDLVRDYLAESGTEDVLSRAQFVDFKLWLAGDILPKVDRTSMAVSLEVRAPLLDHELAEWALSLSPQDKIEGVQGKSILKKAFEEKLPHDILYRPKQGFSIPLAAWFRGPLSEPLETLAESGRLLETGYFDVKALREIVGQHQSGRRDHSRLLWLLFMFESFMNRQ